MVQDRRGDRDPTSLDVDEVDSRRPWARVADHVDQFHPRCVVGLDRRADLRGAESVVSAVRHALWSHRNSAASDAEREGTDVTVNDLQRLFDYGYWANAQLFNVLSHLTQ